MAGIFDTYNANRRSSLEDTQGFFDQATQRKAGGMLAGGDYTGAAGALYGGGLLTQGSQVQALGQAQTDRADKKTSDAKKEAAAISKDEQEQRLKFLAQGAKVLLSVPVDQRGAAFQQSIAPALKAMGADDAAIQQAGSALDDVSLQTFSGEVNKALEPYTLSPGSRRYDGNNKLVAETPFAPQYKEVSPGETLVQVGGGSAPMPGGIQEAVQSLVPGATITSGRRSAAHNAEVGGAPNSYHLQGRALDIVPPQGMSMKDLETSLRGSGLNFKELINEGDHVHVAWADEPAGAKVIAQGAAKPGARPATAAEKAAYGIGPEIPAQVRPDGSIDVISGVGATQRRVPAKIQEGFVGNNSSVKQIDEAIAAVNRNPGALGLKNHMGEAINQRVDPNGVDVRAAVANIGSLLIHDRSGAAVTAAETPRLLPFIPQVTDTPEAVVKKLKALRRQYENANSEIEVTYGEESGYGPLGGGQSAKPTTRPPLDSIFGNR